MVSLICSPGDLLPLSLEFGYGVTYKQVTICCWVLEGPGRRGKIAMLIEDTSSTHISHLREMTSKKKKTVEERKDGTCSLARAEEGIRAIERE